MRPLLLVALLAFGLAGLSGCSDAKKNQPTGEAAPPPADSGADKNIKTRPKPP